MRPARTGQVQLLGDTYEVCKHLTWSICLEPEGHAASPDDAPIVSEAVLFLADVAAFGKTDAIQLVQVKEQRLSLVCGTNPRTQEACSARSA